MSPHTASELRAAVWNGGGGFRARNEGLEDTSRLRAGTGASFRRACLIIAAWLIALLSVPIFFFQPF
jgi:hypothetical protein